MECLCTIYGKNVSFRLESHTSERISLNHFSHNFQSIMFQRISSPSLNPWKAFLKKSRRLPLEQLDAQRNALVA